MADKMSIDKAIQWLNAFNIIDQEQREFIIDSRHQIPEHETAETIVHLSRGKTLEWIKKNYIQQ